MEKDDYKELNNYLNMMMNYMYHEERFIYDNLEELMYVWNDYILLFEDYSDLEIPEGDRKYLTYQEVLDKCKEIIATFSDEYAQLFDTIVADGTLELDYDGEINSECTWKNDKAIIDIARNNNYLDILTLIHEFMHFTKTNEYMTDSWDKLTEFISIYFELYAADYLEENYGISADERVMERLLTTYYLLEDISYDFVSLYLFKTLGRIDENSYEFSNKFFMYEDKETYEANCQSLLENFREAKEEYEENLGGEDYDEEDLSRELYESVYLRYGFEYGIGTILSFFAFRNYTPEDIVNINESLDSVFAEDSPYDYLNMIDFKTDRYAMLEGISIINDVLEAIGFEKDMKKVLTK